MEKGVHNVMKRDLSMTVTAKPGKKAVTWADLCAQVDNTTDLPPQSMITFKVSRHGKVVAVGVEVPLS